MEKRRACIHGPGDQGGTVTKVVPKMRVDIVERLWKSVVRALDLAPRFSARIGNIESPWSTVGESKDAGRLEIPDGVQVLIYASGLLRSLLIPAGAVGGRKYPKGCL